MLPLVVCENPFRAGAERSIVLFGLAPAIVVPVALTSVAMRLLQHFEHP